MAMTLRLNDEEDRALTLLAQANGTSKQAAAIRAIVVTAARTVADAQVREHARAVIEEYGDLWQKVRR